MARLGLRVAWPSYLARSIGSNAQCDARETSTRASYTSIRRVTPFELCPHTGSRADILVRHADFNYKWKVSETTKFQPGCTSTPSARRAGVPRQLADWLDSSRNVRLAFPTRTFQLEAGTKRLARLYARAELLLCSRAAANIITVLPRATRSTFSMIY